MLTRNSIEYLGDIRSRGCQTIACSRICQPAASWQNGEALPYPRKTGPFPKSSLMCELTVSHRLLPPCRVSGPPCRKLFQTREGTALCLLAGGAPCGHGLPRLTRSACRLGPGLRPTRLARGTTIAPGHSPSIAVEAPRSFTRSRPSGPTREGDVPRRHG